MLTCKFLNSSKSQCEILNYQILNNCRVLYAGFGVFFVCCGRLVKTLDFGGFRSGGALINLYGRFGRGA